MSNWGSERLWLAHGYTASGWDPELKFNFNLHRGLCSLLAQAPPCFFGILLQPPEAGRHWREQAWKGLEAECLETTGSQTALQGVVPAANQKHRLHFCAQKPTALACSFHAMVWGGSRSSGLEMFIDASPSPLSLTVPDTGAKSTSGIGMGGREWWGVVGVRAKE